MPLTRYRVRSEYGLADPELYRAADKDDPEALLEGVAMAGLVGVLRQLGDLAEFAAEIFHDLHEEVLATSARGHGLIARVQQLEAEFPPIEKVLLSQTNQSLFHYNAGVDWHPNLRFEQNLVARGDLPRFVMDSYEESRGPPRLFLLDKFDVAGAGACLKRYTDPSFFKIEAAASGKENLEIPREKKNRRYKKKGARWRNGETTPDAVPASHSRLEQLFLEERIENGHSDPARLMKLKRRHVNGSDHGAGKSYMERFVETPEERELACEKSIVPVSFTPEYTSESGVKILDISTVSPGEKSLRRESASSSPNIHENASKSSTNGYGDDVGDAEIIKMTDTSGNDETSERSSNLHEVQAEREVRIYGEEKRKRIVNGYESDDLTSEVDNYLDAVASMESEIETDNEYRPNSTTCFLKDVHRGTDSEANKEPTDRRTQLSDSQSVGNCSTSDDGNNSFKRNRSNFSCSDSPSSLVEKTQVCSESGGSEIVEDSSNGPSETTESVGAMPDKLVVSPDTSGKEENIRAYREASGSGSVGDLHSIEQHGFAAASSVEAASLEGSETGGTPTEYTLPDSRVRNTAENEVNLIDAVVAEPQISSQVSEDITKTTGRHLADESEAEDPKVSEPASENEDCKIKEELKETEKGPGSDEDEPQGISQEELCSSPWANSGTSIPFFSVCRDRLDILEPEKLAPGVEDIVSPVKVHTDDLYPILVTEEKETPEESYRGDSPETTGIKEAHYPDFTEDVPHDKPVLEETSVLLSKESASKEDSGVEDFKEAGSATSHDISLPSDACLPPETTSLPEPLISTMAPKQKEAEFLERVSPECDVESETSVETDLALTPSVSTSYGDREEICDVNGDSLPAENTQNSFPVIDRAETSRSLEAGDQKPESVQSDHFINREDVMSVPTSHQPEPEDSLELPADHVSAECPVRARQLDAARFDSSSVASKNTDTSNNYIGEQTAFQKDLSSVSPQEDESDQSSMLEFSSESAVHEVNSTHQASNPFEHVAPNVVLVPEAAQVDIVEMPPLPPLPPMQWRMGLGAGTGTGLGMGMGSFLSTPLQGNRGFFPTKQPLRADEKAAELPVSHTATQQLENPVSMGMGSFQSTPLQANWGFFPALQPLMEDEKDEAGLPASHTATQQPENPVFPLAIEEDEKPRLVPESAKPNHYNPFASPPAISSERHEEEAVQFERNSSSQPHTSTITQDHDVPEETNELPSQPELETGLDATKYPNGEQGSSVVVDEQPPLGLVMPIGATRWSSNNSGTVSETESQKEIGNPVPKIPRPRNPLIDEVNAHGTSKLRKVAERVRPQLGPKADERDSMLEQIRTKSFNLKPTTATRPSMGPTFNKTNLRVAAILEKANAIRQSLAGSDDDEDDEDNWD